MPGQWRDSTRRRRLPANWSATVVRHVLARDAGICYLCGRPGADTVDHIEPGDDHRETNLAAVHDRNPPHCHRYKSSLEGNAARRARRALARHPGERHPGERA